MKSPTLKYVNYSEVPRRRETFTVGFIGGGGGYSVTEPVLEPCEVCGSNDHWELDTFESYSQIDNYFEYRCRGTVVGADQDEWQCNGVLTIHDEPREHEHE